MEELISDVSGVFVEGLTGSDSCASGSFGSEATVGVDNISRLLAECSVDWGDVENSGSADEVLEDRGGVGALILLRKLKGA